MRQSKNILTDKEMELVSLLVKDCQSTGAYFGGVRGSSAYSSIWN